MAGKYALTLLVLSLAMSTVVCQTFQYSRGWTNGKRSVTNAPDEFLNSIVKNGQADSGVLSCAVQKLRIILQGNFNDQLLQVPCDLFGSSKRGFPDNMGQFRRETTSNTNNF